MSNISVETKGPKETPFTESLLPTPNAGSIAGFKRGLAVVYGADEFHAVLPAAAGVDIVGVIDEDAISAENPIRVIQLGQAPVQIGAAVAAGAPLAVNAAGQFVTAAAGNKIVAKALTANANAGDYITAFILPAGAVVPAA